MMGTEMVPEKSVIFNQLTWLIAQEDFINGSKSLKNVKNENILGRQQQITSQ
jgi:hypothetical protein